MAQVCLCVNMMVQVGEGPRELDDAAVYASKEQNPTLAMCLDVRSHLKELLYRHSNQ